MEEELLDFELLMELPEDERARKEVLRRLAWGLEKSYSRGEVLEGKVVSYRGGGAEAHLLGPLQAVPPTLQLAEDALPQWARAVVRLAREHGLAFAYAVGSPAVGGAVMVYDPERGASPLVHFLRDEKGEADKVSLGVAGGEGALPTDPELEEMVYQAAGDPKTAEQVLEEVLRRREEVEEKVIGGELVWTR